MGSGLAVSLGASRATIPQTFGPEEDVNLLLVDLSGPGMR